jgi:hypothetical protein
VRRVDTVARETAMPSIAGNPLALVMASTTSS